MSNYATARINMVDSQIHTAGVVSAPVLEAFRTVPRELFVPEELRGLVYADEDLPLGNGHFMMEPAMLARMIEAANVTASDAVLNIGDSTGYSSAILATLARTVTTPEDVTQGEAFSLILMNGAFADQPDNLMPYLMEGGRLIGIHRPAGAKIGTVTLTERVGSKHYSTRKLFDAGTPYIPGYEPKPRFTF